MIEYPHMMPGQLIGRWVQGRDGVLVIICQCNRPNRFQFEIPENREVEFTCGGCGEDVHSHLGEKPE